ncbi:unnamed protein product [Lactuca saligna]|uniref:Uncharacterized protein n=1 Tax=Lactuca saligna TaxID=75948 RepID=A0AA36EE45_LACSI|nr:unnamed protein product [Lactuca saligna]
MNPHNWLSLFLIVSKDVQKCEPIVQHLKRMIKCYILDFVKMDVKIAYVLKKRPIVKPKEQPKCIQFLKTGIIRNKHWSIVYKRKEEEVVQNFIFFFRYKHLYSSSALKKILFSAKAHKVKSPADIKCVADMIR